MLRKTNSQKGFTIIEVVITIAIGAAVMALVLNAVSGARRSQRNNARIADIGVVATAVNNYYGSRNALPAASTDIEELLIGELAYYEDAATTDIRDLFVANAFNANSNNVGAFSTFGTAATAGQTAAGGALAALDEDHMGLVRQAGCDTTFANLVDGGIREMALVYNLEGQTGVVCREI